MGKWMLKTSQSTRTDKFFVLLLSLMLLFLLFLSKSSCFLSKSSYLHLPNSSSLSFLADTSTTCVGRYIYVYDLPNKFNSDIVRNCQNLLPYHHMCPSVLNMGLGSHVTDTGSVLTQTGWYITNQWLLDFIFHNRMRQYECLTVDSSKANAFFIPYYIGLDAGRQLWNTNVTGKDLLLLELFDMLRLRPEWSAKGGRDHFILSGRTSWDFRRQSDDGWGGKLLTLLLKSD